ncbi:MAG: hypothetical protein ACYC7C_05175 [Coriobacteriia bacterium]
MVFDDAAIAARAAGIDAGELGLDEAPTESHMEYRELCDAFVAAARRLGREPGSRLIIQGQLITERKCFLFGTRKVSSTQRYNCPCWPIPGAGYVVLSVGELVQLRSVETPSRYATTVEAHLTVPSALGLAALEDRMLGWLAAPEPAHGEYTIQNSCEPILALYGY